MEVDQEDVLFQEQQEQQEGEDQEQHQQEEWTAQHLLAGATPRDVLDPDQADEEKRWLRQQYRQLIHATEESRQELVTGNRNRLLENLQKASTLYEKVRSTADATLDSRLLVISADLGAQRAQHRNAELRQFDVDDFLVRVQQRMRTGAREQVVVGDNDEWAGGEDDEDVRAKSEWLVLGNMARRFMHTAPTVSFMLGPLSVEHKQRRQVKQTRLVRDKTVLKKPEELKAADIKKDENETTKNILSIYRRLEEVGPLPFWQFVCNPESFSQTVENIFYCAFLARDGKISIHETEDCQLPDAVIEAIEAAPEEERARMEKFQYMVSLDMKVWRKLIKKYDIEETVIPTRAAAQVRLNTASGSKWYG